MSSKICEICGARMFGVKTCACQTKYLSSITRDKYFALLNTNKRNEKALTKRNGQLKFLKKEYSRLKRMEESLDRKIKEIQGIRNYSEDFIYEYAEHQLSQVRKEYGGSEPEDLVKIVGVRFSANFGGKDYILNEDVRKSMIGKPVHGPRGNIIGKVIDAELINDNHEIKYTAEMNASWL
jgi:hypothetical protein